MSKKNQCNHNAIARGIGESSYRCVDCGVEIKTSIPKEMKPTPPQSDKQQSDWGERSDEIIINFFEELRPPKKGETYTFLIPLMVELKSNLEEAVKQARAETLKEVLEELPVEKSPELTGNIMTDSVMDGFNQALQQIRKIIKNKLK